jgi:outer membrane protein assembly factor BamB
MKKYALFLSCLFFMTCEHDKHETIILTGPDGELCASEAVWSHGRGDLQNSRRAAGIRKKECLSGPKTTPQVQWSFSIGGPGSEAPPVIGDDGTIYLTGEYPGEVTGGGVRNAGLFAVSPNGTMKWFFNRKLDVGNAIGAIYSQSVAIGSDGTIYFGCWDSTLYAINPENASVKWKYKSSFVISPVIDNNGNIYASNDTIFCFRPDGTIKWRYVNEAFIGYCWEISLSHNYIFCAFLQNGILALDYAGHKKWFYSVDYENDGGKDGILIDENENLYLKTNSNNIKSWDRDGSLRWEGSLSNIGGMTQPVLRGDYLYFGAFGGLYKLDKLTGKNLEVIADVPDAAYLSQFAAPIIDDEGIVFIVSDGGLNFSPYMMAASEIGTTTLWTKQMTEAISTGFHGYLALSYDGTIYWATTNVESMQGTNKLYAIK